jgi:hypothetical protein
MDKNAEPRVVHSPKPPWFLQGKRSKPKTADAELPEKHATAHPSTNENRQNKIPRQTAKQHAKTKTSETRTIRATNPTTKEMPNKQHLLRQGQAHETAHPSTNENRQDENTQATATRHVQTKKNNRKKNNPSNNNSTSNQEGNAQQTTPAETGTGTDFERQDKN